MKTLVEKFMEFLEDLKVIVLLHLLWIIPVGVFVAWIFFSRFLFHLPHPGFLWELLLGAAWILGSGSLVGLLVVLWRATRNKTYELMDKDMEQRRIKL